MWQDFDMTRKPHPSDVSDAEWELVPPYLTLMGEGAPQREYPSREVFNGLRGIVRSGATCRMMPNDLPPSNVVHQPMQRWIKAQVFEVMADDLRYGTAGGNVKQRPAGLQPLPPSVPSID